MRDLSRATQPPDIDPGDFEEGFGEPIERTLDIDTWRSGEDLGEVYTRIEREVREAVAEEDRYRVAIRQHVFPQIARYPGAPAEAGVYTANREAIARIHRGILLNGGIEACDGTILSHDSLPLTIFQVGISLVSYRGHQGVWSHRLFRRDLRVTGEDPVDEALELLARRDERSALNHTARRDTLSRLAQSGIMAYAERAILLRRSDAVWRMGHGNPAPFELLTGSGSLDLMIEATRLLRELIEEHQKFVYVASEPRERLLLTIGDALHPLQYAIVRSLRDTIYATIERGKFGGIRYSADTTWDGRGLTPMEWLLRFRDEVAPQVVVGVYRASRVAPPQIFFAHRDHVHVAAHIAIADSVMQEHRGFPLLIDLADSVCRSVFNRDTLAAPVASASVAAGAPFRYTSERQTRYG